MIYVQNVPFIVSLSTTAVLGFPDGCQLAVLGSATIAGTGTATL